jgi:hypothetical protein
MSNSAPIVFISYSYDSEEHRERVLGLAERLRKDGYPTRLDRYVNGMPAGDWAHWIRNQLREAAFTLMVCTETYYQRFWGDGVPDRGHGVAFEGVLITNALYQSKCQLVKFVPILFDSTHKQFIPEPLRGGTHYLLDSEGAYQELRKFLDRAAGVEPGSLGEYKTQARTWPSRCGNTTCPTSLLGRIATGLRPSTRNCSAILRRQRKSPSNGEYRENHRLYFRSGRDARIDAKIRHRRLSRQLGGFH